MPLNPHFPVVSGTYQLTKRWAMTLPVSLNRRSEDGQMVLWRPGFTIWISIWNNDKNETVEERLKWIESDASPAAFEKQLVRGGDLARLSYRLNEEKERGAKVYTLYSYTIGSDGHVQAAFYFDKEWDIQLARQIHASFVMKESPE